MFSPEDILVLSKAGFTAQQIAGLSAMANNPAPEHAPPVVAPVPVTQPVATQNVPASTPAPASTTAPVATPASQPVDPILAELQKLTGLVQNGNIAGSSMPKPQTPEEILAEIINPPIKKE